MPIRIPLASIRLRLLRRRLLRATRARLSRAFGVSKDGQAQIVERMLRGHPGSAATYWLQLCIALSIATLGLVLNGAAVVIGAMLVSPLMTPIVELGMGLAVGSPLLSIRSLVRTFWSIIVVVVGATLITRALPFHEMTSEIAARTSPTALDLLVAIFCALAASLTTVRSASDSASAAAGTAVAIALVPPLCVVGFGLGTADRAIAGGAFLLFTANLCAILLFAVLSFWLVGFNLVDTRKLEEERFEGEEPTSRSVRWVKRGFGSRYGTWLRLIIPIALVAAVWFPLSRALREVTWEVRTRAQVQRIIHDLPGAQAAVRSSVSVEHRMVRVRMIVVARPSAARDLQAVLVTRISQACAAAPTVEVLAVPDLETMQEVAHSLVKHESAELPPPPDLVEASGEVGEALKRAWPVRDAGDLIRWRLDLTDREHPRLEVVHLGRPLGATVEVLLGSLLSERLHVSLAIRDLAVPGDAITAIPEDGQEWVPALASAVQWLRMEEGLSACVTLASPSQAKGKRGRRSGIELADIRKAAMQELTRAPAGRLHWVDGTSWSVQLKSGSCENVTPGP